MKLEKTLAYLESQLKAPGVELDAYQSWLNDKSDETLSQRYAWYAYNSGTTPKDEALLLMEALEEVHRELEKVSFNGIFSDLFSDLGDKYLS